MAKTIKTTEKVAKKREEKITKILGFPVKSTLRTAILYEDRFGYDMVNDALDFQRSLIETPELPSFSTTGLIRLLWAMVATADEKYRTESGYDEFLDSTNLNLINNEAADILSLTIINAQSGEEEEAGK